MAAVPLVRSRSRPAARPGRSILPRQTMRWPSIGLPPSLAGAANDMGDAAVAGLRVGDRRRRHGRQRRGQERSTAPAPSTLRAVTVQFTGVPLAGPSRPAGETVPTSTAHRSWRCSRAAQASVVDRRTEGQRSRSRYTAAASQEQRGNYVGHRVHGAGAGAGVRGVAGIGRGQRAAAARRHGTSAQLPIEARRASASPRTMSRRRDRDLSAQRWRAFSPGTVTFTV